MPDARVTEWIRNKYVAVVGDLDERGRRRWAAAEARSLGRGGIAAVAQATCISDRTIRDGIKELESDDALGDDRQRRSGGGRKSREQEQPDLVDALESLVDPASRGDPMSPLRWTCKSTRVLAEELQSQGYQVSGSKVRQMLKACGYSLQSNRKTREGKQHPDRNAQFEHICRRVRAQQRHGEPAVSVDTKKKEVLGNLKNAGKTYRPQGQPEEVDVHDFPDPKRGKGVPYGCMTSPRTKRPYRSVSVTTPPSSRSPRFGGGGIVWAGKDTSPHDVYWSPPTLAAATGIGRVCGRSLCKHLPMQRAW